MKRKRYLGSGAVIALLGLLVGLLLLSVVNTRDASGQAGGPNRPERVFALTTGDDLLRFDRDDPRQTVKKEIRGLRGGEGLVGIDFRPSRPDATQGKLYGLGDEGYIYTINSMRATAERGSGSRPTARRWRSRASPSASTSTRRSIASG